MKFKVLSLFDGISVAQQALTELGYDLEYYASEVDKYCISVTQHNFPNTIQLGDVTKVNGTAFDDINLIIGGSPCVDLSVAKANRQGLEGSKSKLFYEYVRILKECRTNNPDVLFVLENVNSMPKKDRDIITDIMGVEAIMLDAKLLSAQSRKRLFWTNIPNITQPKDKHIYLKDILENGDVDRLKSYCIDASYYKGGNLKSYFESGRRQLVFNGPDRIGDIGSNAQAQRVYSDEGKSVTLSAQGGGQGAKTGLYLVKGVARRTRDSGVKETEFRSDDKAKRKLTPIECERLQSLPDNFTAIGIQDDKIIDISKTQRYKMLGNAFNCAVIKHILGSIEREI